MVAIPKRTPERDWARADERTNAFRLASSRASLMAPWRAKRHFLSLFFFSHHLSLIFVFPKKKTENVQIISRRLPLNPTCESSEHFSRRAAIIRLTHIRELVYTDRLCNDPSTFQRCRTNMFRTLRESFHQFFN